MTFLEKKLPRNNSIHGLRCTTGTGAGFGSDSVHIQSPCTSRSLGEVASSSSGQQAREQKRSAGRKLGGGDDDLDY